MATNAVKQFESQETENCCLNNSELNMHNQSQSEKTKNLECSGGPDPGTCENCGQKVSADGDTPSIVSTTTTQFIKNTSPTVSTVTARDVSHVYMRKCRVFAFINKLYVNS